MTGGRDFGDRGRAFRVLDSLMESLRIRKIVHGAARGADSLAGEWARNRQVLEVPCPAQWDLYGRRAGFLRNQQMLDQESVDLVVAFPGGRGTADMTRRAWAAGVTVVYG